MKKCKIKSIKSLGKQMTYNVAMRSSQHNYALYDKKTGYKIITANSHSAAYSFLAYQTCWLKEYYPIEFMCNLLTSEINNNDKNLKLNTYISAATKMDIPCVMTDINKSGLSFTIETNEDDVEVLRSPFTMLPGVGSKAVKDIVKNQPFKNLRDFVDKIDARVVNIRVFKTLVDSGCMDKSWGVSHVKLLKDYPEMKKEKQKEKKARQKQKENMDKYGGGSLFGEKFDYSGKDLNF